MLDTLNHDVYVNGNLGAKTFSPPAGCIGNAAIAAGAGLAATKLQHQHEITYGQPGGAISFTERKVIHVIKGATGNVLNFRAGIRTACVGAATITFDLQKNGSSILTAVITVDNTKTAYQLTEAAIATPAVVQGDVLEAVIVATAGGGTLGDGGFCDLVLTEDAQ